METLAYIYMNLVHNYTQSKEPSITGFLEREKFLGKNNAIESSLEIIPLCLV